MSAVIPRANWVKLYKELQREAAKLSQYNYRLFAQRRVRDHFEKNRGVTDVEAQQSLFKKGEENLSVIRRTVILDNLYPHKKTVVEEQVEAKKKSH